MRWLGGLGFLVIALSACGGGNDGKSSETSSGGSTRPSSEVVETTYEAVTCPDDLGDVSALGRSRLDDVVVLTADMVGTTVTVSGEDVEVRWDMAPGAAAARASGGNHQHELLLERADGGKPYVTLSVGFAGPDRSAVVSTNTEEAGLVWENDPDGVVVEVDGDSVLLSVPVALLADIGADEWRWYAESSAGKADAATGEQAMGQDTCGTAMPAPDR